MLNPVACTDEFVFGLNISAVDAETGAEVSEGLMGVAIRDGEPSDMEVFGNLLQGAGEQPGTYTVVVSATGYELWTQTDIHVGTDECHVDRVELVARLIPSAAI